MGRKSKIVLIGLGGLVAGLIVIPPVELALVEQPSCFAFSGVIPSRDTARDQKALAIWKKKAFEARQRALAQNAIRLPKPPYVIITRFEGIGDEAAVNILAAQEEDETPDAWRTEPFGRSHLIWRIYEANQAFDAATNKLSSDFEAQPTRVVSKPKLSRLIRKRCVFNEPAAAGFPRVWLSIFHTTVYYDGEYRLIEVNDGERREYFVRAGRRLGIAGAVSQLLVHNAIGFSSPPNPGGLPPDRDPATEYR